MCCYYCFCDGLTLVYYLSVFASIHGIRVWFFFFFKQKTAYEMRISDWSSDVCSSDLPDQRGGMGEVHAPLDAGDGCGRPRGDRAVGIGDLGVAIEIGRASCRERVCQYV